MRCCFLILIFPLLCSAQKQGNIWYFGNHAGLDFNSGSAVPLLNGQTYSPDGTTIEGSAMISDSTGSLLFYTNGNKIWDKTHQVMPNGSGLSSNFSSTQAALILAQPGSSRYFYVFTVDDFYEDSLKYGFRYSIVDICANSGLGDVITSEKNIKLLDTVCEKLTAVRHSNGIDYWIIVHKYYSDAFYSYHLSALGIIDTVISHVGSRHPNISASQDSWASIGYLKASPNGTKLAIVNGNAGPYTIAECFDFDKNTGVVNNVIDLQTNLALQSQYYGVSFSPDNSKLYISCWLNGTGIYQFDLSAGGGNSDSIKLSKTLITTNVNSNTWALQAATNGKIYVALSGNQYLSVINNPNNKGLNCNYQDSVVYLNGKACGSGLPNFIDSYDYSNTVYNCNNGIAEYTILKRLKIHPNPTSVEISLSAENISDYQNSFVFIQNTFGQTVKKLSFKKDIDVSVLPPGCYVLTLVLDGKSFNVRFLKE